MKRKKTTTIKFAEVFLFTKNTLRIFATTVAVVTTFLLLPSYLVFIFILQVSILI